MKFRVPKTLRNTVEEVLKLRRDPVLVLWSMMVLLFPVYVFPSGLPQPADCLLLVLAPLLFRRWNRRLAPELVKPLKWLLVFTAYVCVINVMWSFGLFTFTLNAKDGFLLSPTFYIYNALMFLTFLVMYQRYGEFVLWLSARLVLVSIFIQLGLALALGGSSSRSTVMFNNPNQLGYYALLSACILLVAQKRLKLSTIQVTAGLAASSYLALLSASKAALFSIAALGVALLISRVQTIIVVALAFTVLVVTDNPFSQAIERASQRIESDQSFSFLEERGYDRVWQNPEYWVVGSGEGGYRRFEETTMIGAHELHSSMATLFFCYGIIGLTLFAVFSWGMLWGTGFRIWTIVAAAFAYGMTHQGLRFRLFWLLLGMVASLRHLRAVERRNARAKRLAVERSR